MDNLTRRDQPDRSRINMSEDFEVKYWIKALGVDRDNCKERSTRSEIPPQRSARSWVLLAALTNGKPQCQICFGIGWVCENHPKRAWSAELGCQCGAGMPCECQHANGLEEPNTSGVIANNPRRHRREIR